MHTSNNLKILLVQLVDFNKDLGTKLINFRKQNFFSSVTQLLDMSVIWLPLGKTSTKLLHNAGLYWGAFLPVMSTTKTFIQGLITLDIFV